MSNSERDEFQKLIPVSHETLVKLDRYAELLGEWNQKFNLVADSTLPHIWNRHFLDSAQLLKHIPYNAVVADIGSGAGFPGLMLSILGIKNIHLIESIGKKASFLCAVINDLKLDAVVHQERAESLQDLKADIITARAVGPLSDLLNWSNPLRKKDSFCLFLKGRSADVELTESAKYWRFDCEKIPSISDPSGSVFILRNINNAALGKTQQRKIHSRKRNR